MGSLWQFFGLPDPEGGTAPSRAPASAANTSDEPVSLTSANEASPAPTPATVEPGDVTPQMHNISQLRTPPPGWNGPLTPDGEAFHDLGVVVQRNQPHPSKALRYIAPDVMKRIPTTATLERALQGDTASVDPRSLGPRENHQMASRRETKHLADAARRRGPAV